MSSASSIVVLTNSYDDAHVGAVSQHLTELGQHLLRVNIDDLLKGRQSITWNYQSSRVIASSADRDVDLSKVKSVWFRKPFGFGSKYGFAESINDIAQRRVVEQEVRDIVNGLGAALASSRWTNHPREINQARLKPYQLQLARSLGLLVPDSIITNDPTVARSFCKEFPAVFKMLTSQVLEYGEAAYGVDTTLMTDDLIDRLDFIRSQPILLQRHIDKTAELRVTCIGDEVFVARQTVEESVSSTVDWRDLQDSTNSRYEPWSIPPKLVAQIQSLLKSLNLTFAAIDFAVDRNKTPWFLEVNPNGQWLGYTDEIGIPAAASMARLLAP